jgi:hypothetical protein
MKLTTGRIIATGVIIPVAILVAVGMIAAYTPPAHDVHAPGGSAIKAQLVYSDKPVYVGRSLQPSQSLDVVRCEIWFEKQNQQPNPCPNSATLASQLFPNLTQSSKTLYFPWDGCSVGSRDGYNIEYLETTQTLVIHCYAAESLLALHWSPHGVMAMHDLALLLIPTDSIPPGSVITIVEEDRAERLLREWSTETELAIATIS